MFVGEASSHRPLKTIELTTDLVVVGGGLAGTCCALTAARHGIEVVLIQDRPVLGGNASSEVRLWALGATSHMGNNNRWAREGGVIDELVVENVFRNPEGNALIFDTILLEKVWEEQRITLLLNTSVYEVEKATSNSIAAVTAFCSQNSTNYRVHAPYFCDASGDGIVGFLAGAAFRMGAEAADEFNEPFAPDQEYGELLGHSMFFMSKDVGKPVGFTPPKFALKDITKVPRYRNFNVKDQACWMWWIEYGGRLDTVHDTETIKWELWKVVYGVWDYIKNSGKFPEAENLTLEWVGHIPGKRESRRFEGPYMLTQGDVVSQRQFDDAVSFGGWAIDIHPADGVFSEKPACNQWHSKGVYQIPYGSLFSRNIDNLFLAGRIISASHLAFGSTRVMMTCAHAAQVVGVAASLGKANGWKPADLLTNNRIKLLQETLIKSGQYIPGLAISQPHHYQLSASSELSLDQLPFDGPWRALDFSMAQLIPLPAGAAPSFELEIKADAKTTLLATLRSSQKSFNYTPEIVLGTEEVALQKGVQRIILDFKAEIRDTSYTFLCFQANPKVSLRCTETRVTGLVSVFNKHNKAVSNFGKQDPDPGIGFEKFEFWTPERRPGGQNIAMLINPALDCFSALNINNGYYRPYLQPNAWVADLEDQSPVLSFEWSNVKTINKILLSFDTDFDHPMESSIWAHPERVMPFVVRAYEIMDENEAVIFSTSDNHQTRNEILFGTPVKTKKLTIRFQKPVNNVPVSVFGVDIN
ncbi:MAG: hypothetical protein DHS20C17_35370 [Cyclobacteriaceae bacterium]|nr:MAG: hypothetical protein DHS20C17_35370 [Cyclobacteriaceae bacterium]